MRYDELRVEMKRGWKQRLDAAEFLHRVVSRWANPHQNAPLAQYEALHRFFEIGCGVERIVRDFGGDDPSVSSVFLRPPRFRCLRMSQRTPRLSPLEAAGSLHVYSRCCQRAFP